MHCLKGDTELNKTIHTILNHKSIRKFKNVPLTNKEIEVLVKSAQAASTSSYNQPYSIIGVTDYNKKQKIEEIAFNHSFVSQSGYLFIFCIDWYRHKQLAETRKVNILKSIENTESFMTSLIDAALAAQNLTIAAESLGLGICYLGGIRNNLEEIDKIVSTPNYVIPIFGIVVGVPDQTRELKPRLPIKNIFHVNRYIDDLDFNIKYLNEYDNITKDYYANRKENKRKDYWSQKILRNLKENDRHYMTKYVKRKKLNRE